MNLDLPQVSTGGSVAPAPSVFVATPSGDMVHARFWRSYTVMMLTAQQMLNAGKLSDLGFDSVRTSILPLGRDVLTQEAIDGGYSHILWIDSDATVPPWTIERLLSLNLDIVGASFSKRQMPPEPTTAHMNSDGSFVPHVELGHNQPFEINVGYGLMLVRTEVYKTLEQPWHQFELISKNRYLPEDYYFCRAARAAGFKVYCDPVVSRWVGHAGFHEYRLVDPFSPTGQFEARQCSVTLEKALAAIPVQRVVDRRL